MDSELIKTTSLWLYSYQLMIDKSKEREKENTELRQTGMPQLAGNTSQLLIASVKKGKLCVAAWYNAQCTSGLQI